MVSPTFETAFRVYYSHTDAGGVVYHAQYLTFAEHARAEVLRSIGHPLVSGTGAQFVVRRATVEWTSPARLDDLLTCRTRIKDLRGARIIMRQDFDVDGRAAAVVEVEIAHITSTGRPVKLPADLIAKLG